MSNILIVPDSGSIYFTTGSAGSSAIPNLSSGVAFKFDNSAGVNITSYATGVSDNDRFSIDGYNGRLFNVSDNLTGIIFSVNDGAGLPIIEVDSGAVDKVTMGTYGTNTFVIDGNKVGIGTGVPAAKLDIFDNVLAGSAGLAGSVLNLAQTWNTTGTPSAIKLNVTDTASNASSNLMDLRSNNVSKFIVQKGANFGDYAFNVRSSASRVILGSYGPNGGDMIFLSPGNTNVGIKEGYFLSIGVDSYGNAGVGVALYKDAANILAQRNATNPQAFRLYNTYTSSTNFERLNLKWDTNVLKIGTEKGTEGGVARAMEFQTDGIARLILRTDGYVDIGATPLITESNDVDGVNGNRFKVIGNLAFGGGGLMIRSSTINSSSRLVVACPNNAQATSAYLFGIDGLQLNKGLIYTNSDQSISLVNGSGGNNDTYTRILNITSAGNVGIGTTTPTQKLDVNGTSRLGGNVIVDGDSLTMASSGWVQTFGLSYSGPTTHRLSSGYDLELIGGGESRGVTIRAGIDTARFTSGKVGIGTLTPTARLDIVDTTLAIGGSLAGSVLNIAQTWDTINAPTAIKLNITNTASSAASNLLDLQVGGVSQFKVRKDGLVNVPIIDASPNTTPGYFFGGGRGCGTANEGNSSTLVFWGNSSKVAGITNNGSQGQFAVVSHGFIGFLPASNFNAATDVSLYRDAAGILAQRNGINAQTFRLYNTYTDATTFERLNIKWDTNVLKIGTEKGSAGGVARAMEFQTDATTRITINDIGNVGIGTTTPTEKLHVLGNIKNVGNLSISNSDIATTLDRLTVDGSQGRLFTVTDSLVGSLMSVNDIAGLPILEVFDDDKIVMGEYASNALTVLGKNVGIGTGSPTAKLDILDTVLAGSGSLAGSALNLAQTWNTTGNPTAIKLNITNTASGATSNLLDLQIGGVSTFKVTKNGSIYALGGLSYNNEVGQYTFRATSFLALGDRVGFGDSGFTVGSGRKFNFATNWGWETAEFSLLREGSHIMAQRGVVSTNPQSFRIYNTYTSGTNFERLNLRWDTNVVKIGTEKGSAGGVARDLSFETDATTRMTIAISGNIGIGTITPNSKLTVTGGDVEITDTTAGVIFKTPDGTNRYRMTIDNAGAPVFTLLV